jgi:hypothetical protein
MTAMSEDVGMDAWFVHEKLVCNLLTASALAELSARMPRKGDPLYESFRLDALERAVADYLVSNDVPSLAIEQERGDLRKGQLFWLNQAISFKGTGAAWSAVRSGSDPAARATFSALLDTNPMIRVEGDFSAERLTCNSAVSQLSGTTRQFVLGYITDVGDTVIKVRPIAIAWRWAGPQSGQSSWMGGDNAHVWPIQVDQFAHVDFRKRLVKTDLETLRNVSEEYVKRSFAEILGEPEVPKDWGGEQFDLWVANRLTIDGVPQRAAFAFKGPARFHPMRIADLGKNGDQIDRLAQTAADLIVVQHCQTITAPVVNMLKAYATSPRNSKRYMTIDGYDTIRILRSSNKL